MHSPGTSGAAAVSGKMGLGALSNGGGLAGGSGAQSQSAPSIRHCFGRIRAADRWSVGFVPSQSILLLLNEDGDSSEHGQDQARAEDPLTQFDRFDRLLTTPLNSCKTPVEVVVR
jgi:hypothetical protein